MPDEGVDNLRQQMKEAIGLAREYHRTFQTLRAQLHGGDDERKCEIQKVMTVIIKAWQAQIDTHMRLKQRYAAMLRSEGTIINTTDLKHGV